MTNVSIQSRTTSKSFLITDFEPWYGEAVQVRPNVTRVTAKNPGAFAGWGTNTYLVGRDDLIVIDPGPSLDEHWRALMEAIGDRRITHICVSHLHPDHSPLAWRFSKTFQAPVLLGDPTHSAHGREEFDQDASIVETGYAFGNEDCRLRVVRTPGHTWGHTSFELVGAATLFSGDHVMGWATPTISPPQGDMDVYLRSLDETIAAGYQSLLPAHGPAIDDAGPFLAAYRCHRLDRERQVQALICQRARTTAEIVQLLYTDLPERLRAAAMGTTTAHLLRLRRLGSAVTDGDVWRATGKTAIS